MQNLLPRFGNFFIKYWTYIHQYGIEVHGINVILFQSMCSLGKNKTAEKTLVDALYLWKETIDTAESWVKAPDHFTT